jgi:effector-binding domain-containing protein
MSRLRLAAPIIAVLLFSFSAETASTEDRPQIQPSIEQPTPGGLDTPAPLLPGDAFGERVMLPEQTIIYIKGRAKWDSAFETLVDSFKSLHDYFDQKGIKPNGPAMTIYTQTNDSDFQFEAALPVAEAPKDPPKGDIAVGHAPSGKALKFVHRGSYGAMDTTYEAITNYLDDKNLEAKDLFVEEYSTDPVKADPNQLIVNVFVPVE